MFSQSASLRRRGTNHFPYNYYTGTNPFIHLIGSSLIKWMIVRINGREEPKQDLKVCLGGEVCLGEALLRLSGPESAETSGSDSPRRSDLRLGGALRLGVHSYA